MRGRRIRVLKTVAVVALTAFTFTHVRKPKLEFTEQSVWGKQMTNTLQLKKQHDDIV